MNRKLYWGLMLGLALAVLGVAFTLNINATPHESGIPAFTVHALSAAEGRVLRAREEFSIGASGVLSTSFTYQGRLVRDGEAVDEVCSMTFRLYDQEAGGRQVSSAITTTVTVNDGLFMAHLSFGDAAFDGEARWLGIRVLCPSDAAYTELGRQALTAAPYALYALSTGALQGQPVTVTLPAAGQVLKWDGSAWGAADDAGTYSAGFGLDLSGDTFSVITDAIQARVAGACAVGSAVRAVNADGSLVCQVDAPLNRSLAPMTNTLTTVDDSGIVGRHTSVTIGADGLPLISYLDFSNFALSVAHCGDVACTSATVTIVDSGGSVGEIGRDSAVTIGVDGLPLISYRDAINGNLKVAHCEDVACTSAISTTVDTGGPEGSVGYFTSLTIGADGLPVISYWDSGNGDLKVAHCDNVACTSAISTTVDTGGPGGIVGEYNSMTVGVDRLPLISYFDFNNADLKVAHCEDMACTSATVTVLDSEGMVGGETSVTIGTDGLPVISYYDHTHQDLKVAHCQDVACTSAFTLTVDSAGYVGRYTSVTVGPDGLPLISYQDWNNDNLKVAHCGDVACTSATTTVVDTGGPGGDVGEYSSLTIGVDGLPLISYYDGTHSALKVAHCANVFCVPHWRRR